MTLRTRRLTVIADREGVSAITARHEVTWWAPACTFGPATRWWGAITIHTPRSDR